MTDELRGLILREPSRTLRVRGRDHRGWIAHRCDLSGRDLSPVVEVVIGVRAELDRMAAAVAAKCGRTG